MHDLPQFPKGSKVEWVNIELVFEYLKDGQNLIAKFFNAPKSMTKIVPETVIVKADKHLKPYIYHVRRLIKDAWHPSPDQGAGYV